MQNIFVPKKEQHWLLFASGLPFILGIYLSPYFKYGYWMPICIGLSLLLLFFLKQAKRSLLIGVIVLFGLLGLLRPFLGISTQLPKEGNAHITGYVYGEENIKEDGKITCKVGDLVVNGVPYLGYAYVSLHETPNTPTLFDGANISLEGKIYHPQGKTGKTDFDFSLWLKQQGISFGISVYKPVILLNTKENAPIKSLSARLQELIHPYFTKVMGENSRLASSLLLGTKEDLIEEEYLAFQTLGIAHVLCVSGMHVALLAGIFLGLMGLLKIPQKIKFCLLTIFLLFYLILTGFSSATLRATLALLIWQMGKFSGRYVDQKAVFILTMALVLVINPWQAYSLGFLLSFSALAGIILLYSPFLLLFKRLFPERKSNSRLKKAINYWVQSIGSLLSVSLAAQIGTCLPIAYAFQTFPLYALLLNLIVIPIITLLMPFYLIVLCIYPLPIIGVFFADIAGKLSDVFLNTMQLISNLPYASITVARPSKYVFFLLFAICMFVSKTFRIKRIIRIICIIFCVALYGAFSFWQYQQSLDTLRYVQLDVGQADAGIVLDGKYTIVIDTGNEGTEVINYLKNENRNIDALFISHLHHDHVGGIENIIESGIKITHAYLPIGATLQEVDNIVLEQVSLLKKHNIPVTEVSAGDKMWYNQCGFTVLWPEKEGLRIHEDPNAWSLVMDMKFGNYYILQTGDMVSDYEMYSALPSNVLKVGHHGSAYSTSKEYLEFVNPDFAIISTGGNSSSLPSPSTIKRLEDANIPYYSTHINGDITLTIKNGELVVTPYIRAPLKTLSTLVFRDTHNDANIIPNISFIPNISLIPNFNEVIF